MNAINITDSEIESYLLGAVEGDTAESIDELTFIDEDFASRVGAVERDLVDEYLRKELDEYRLRRFETYYLQSEKRRENVRLSRSFGEYVASAVAANEHPIRAEPIEENKLTWKGSWWKFAIPAFAAAVLLAVALPLWLNSSVTRQQANINADADADTNSNQLAQLQPTPEPSIQPTVSPAASETPANQSIPPANENRRVAPPPPRVFAITLMPQTRSSSGERQISIPSDTDRVSVTIKLEPTDTARVRVILTNEGSGAVVWQGTVRPSGIAAGYQSATFRIPTRSLTPGRYRVTASGANGDTEIIGDYPFRLMP